MKISMYPAFLRADGFKSSPTRTRKQPQGGRQLASQRAGRPAAQPAGLPAGGLAGQGGGLHVGGLASWLASMPTGWTARQPRGQHVEIPIFFLGDPRVRI